MKYFFLIPLFFLPIFSVNAAWTIHEDVSGHLQYYLNGDGNYVFRWDSDRTAADQYLYYQNGATFYAQTAIDTAYTDDDSQVPAASTASPNGIGIGSTDVIVLATPTFTTGSPSTAGIIQITIGYLVANSDGSTAPVSA